MPRFFRFLATHCFSLYLGIPQYDIKTEMPTAGQNPMGFDPMLWRNIVEKVLAAKAGHRIPKSWPSHSQKLVIAFPRISVFLNI